MTAVRQHHRKQVRAGGGAVHRAAEPLGHEARDQARVVDVGMREEDKRNVMRLECEPAVLRIGDAATLEHPAVDEKLDLAGLH